MCAEYIFPQYYLIQYCSLISMKYYEIIYYLINKISFIITFSHYITQTLRHIHTLSGRMTCTNEFRSVPSHECQRKGENVSRNGTT